MEPGIYMQVTGNQDDLLDALAVLKGSALSLVTNNGNVFLAFPDSSNLDEVELQSQDLIDRVNGALILNSSGFQPLKLGGMARPNENGGLDYMVAARVNLTLRARVRAVVRDSDGNVKLIPPNPAIEWIEESGRDDTAREILWILSRGEFDWFGLYKLHELVQIDESDKRGNTKKSLGWAIKHGLVTQDQLDRLTGTANNFSAAGRKARHANLNSKPMSRLPMPLEEAAEIMRRVVIGWFEYRQKTI